MLGHRITGLPKPHAYAGVMAIDRSRKARSARRRKRRMGRLEHDLSEEQWVTLKAAWGGCAYCGATDKPLQRDCVLAISAAGVTPSRTSLQPAAHATPAKETTK